MQTEAFDIENIRQALKAEIITLDEASALMEAIKTGDHSIIKKLYEERQKNEKTLADR